MLFSNVVVPVLIVEHMTGKEAIELGKEKQLGKA